MDFEEEYAKCHSVIKVYEKANNLDGIKYELCKLWFLNLYANGPIKSVGAFFISLKV